MKKKLIIGIVIILLVCLGVGLYFIKFEEEKIINDTVKVIDKSVDLDNGEENFDIIVKKTLKEQTTDRYKYTIEKNECI